MYQLLQKFCRKKVCRIIVLRGNLGKISLHLQKLLAPTPVMLAIELSTRYTMGDFTTVKLQYVRTQSRVSNIEP